MPRILGVIAEYNPFHRGHAYHLAQAREAAQADYVVVVMSTCFTQRGEPALLAPADRVRMALACGADAVFALPAVYAVRDAEHFALGGVSILDALGCDAVSFGTETTVLPLLQAVARLLEEPDDAFSSSVKMHLAEGMPYPAAVAQAADAAIPGASALLSHPNSTLALCYLRGMMRIGSQMQVYPVQRCGHYHDTALTADMPSATALRGAILRGDWHSAEAAMPHAAFKCLMMAASCGRIHRPEALDAALLYRLRTMQAEDYAALPDVSEGIEHRLRTAAEEAVTREGLLDAAKTRRYPHARLSRLATHALLSLTHDALQNLPPIRSAWLLGFRKEARELVSILAQRSRLQLLTRSGDLRTDEDWFTVEKRAHDLWALGAGLPSGLALTQGLVNL